MKNKQEKDEMKETKESKTKITKEELQTAMQEKYMEYQMLEEQLKQVQEQIQTLHKQKEDLDNLQDAIHNIAETKELTELFVPVSSGIFVKAEMKDSKEILVNVGNNVVVPKSIPDAVALVQKQKKELETYEKTMMQNFQLLLLHQQKVEAELYTITQNQA